MHKPVYYDLADIEKHNALYNLIFGERSNGKTSAVLELILKNWVEKGEKGAYLRRYEEEIKGGRGEKIWASIAGERDLVSKYTNGQYETIQYYSRAWYLAKWDETLQRYVKQSEPFCYALAISQIVNDKGGAMPEVTTLCFDEFISRKPYLRDEYVDFSNVISTLVRQRGNLRIYMLGNTVNKFCPYFDEMGLYRVDKMKPGSIDLYEYGEESELTVAVEYCETSQKYGGKLSDKYFAFDNPKLKMITSGEWEIPMYPHAPFKIPSRAIKEIFFIEFRGAILQGNIVRHEGAIFIYIHKKTTEIKKDNKKMEYRLTPSPNRNHTIALLRNPKNKTTTYISKLIEQNQVYFETNNIGELFRNYIMESEKTRKMHTAF